MNLTLETAEAIITGARQRATELGLQLAIAVVDDGGHLVALGRMDGAWPLSVRVAEGKAYTAAIMRRPSEAYGKLIEDNPSFAAALASISHQPFVPSGGGLVIERDEVVLGGAGASGAAPHQDIECIAAGFAFANLT